MIKWKKLRGSEEAMKTKEIFAEFMFTVAKDARRKRVEIAPLSSETWRRNKVFLKIKRNGKNVDFPSLPRAVFSHNNREVPRANYLKLFLSLSSHFSTQIITEIKCQMWRQVSDECDNVNVSVLVRHVSPTGKQLQRVLHYSVTPCRPLQSCIRRNDTNAIYDVDCDEVYPRIYIGDA